MTILAHPAIPKSDPATAPNYGADVLLKEANHRIANQLTLLAGMVQLEASAVGKGPATLPREAVKAILDKVKTSVIAMGKLHRAIAQDRPAEVSLADHLIENTSALFSALALTPRPGLRHHLAADCVVTG